MWSDLACEVFAWLLPVAAVVDVLVVGFASAVASVVVQLQPLQDREDNTAAPEQLADSVSPERIPVVVVFHWKCEMEGFAKKRVDIETPGVAAGAAVAADRRPRQLPQQEGQHTYEDSAK